MNSDTRIFPAEWAPQDGILLAWPHPDTDWAPCLDEVEQCYTAIVRAIAADEQVVIVCPDPDRVRRALRDIDPGNITIVDLPTNDTWTRDYGPLTVLENGRPRLLNFTFNAWGMKFAANHDNLVTPHLSALRILDTRIENCTDFVLEGGSIETDGQGTLMTTIECLLSPNRNGFTSPEKIEQRLKQSFNVSNVLWLSCGFLPGDDTDSHIDTLARFLPGGNIVYSTARPGSDEFEELERMREQLATFTDAFGRPYRLTPLPAPAPIRDDDGYRMPATYANFLITNRHIFVPTYRQPDTDAQAVATIAALAGDREVVGIDCLPLIYQHGSLHCATMQLLKGTLSK